MGAPYMPLYFDDLLADTQVLQIETFGAWVKTLGAMWRIENPSVTHASIEAWAQLWGIGRKHDPSKILADMRTVATITEGDDGSITISSGRMAEELQKLQERREKSNRWKRKKRVESPDGHRGDTARIPSGYQEDTGARRDSVVLSSSDLSGREEEGVGGEEKEPTPTSHPWPIAMYVERHGVAPPLVWYNLIAQRVTDRDVWTATLDEWDRSGYRFENVTDLVARYERNAKVLAGPHGQRDGPRRPKVDADDPIALAAAGLVRR
jgi:uncharacterized protein YdaU (DUF1376 family)